MSRLEKWLIRRLFHFAYPDAKVVSRNALNERAKPRAKVLPYYTREQKEAGIV